MCQDLRVGRLFSRSPDSQRLMDRQKWMSIHQRHLQMTTPAETLQSPLYWFQTSAVGPPHVRDLFHCHDSNLECEAQDNIDIASG